MKEPAPMVPPITATLARNCPKPMVQGSNIFGVTSREEGITMIYSHTSVNFANLWREIAGGWPAYTSSMSKACEDIAPTTTVVFWADPEMHNPTTPNMLAKMMNHLLQNGSLSDPRTGSNAKVIRKSALAI